MDFQLALRSGWNYYTLGVKLASVAILYLQTILILEGTILLVNTKSEALWPSSILEHVHSICFAIFSQADLQI